ncbi:MAG: hypothetical protein U0031_05960 [Thermomicrobiales bacterium]
MPGTELMLFYSTLAELVRRHHEPSPVLNAGSLTGYELHLTSENGEDGVIAEIMRRIGVDSRYFIEFGAETGRAGNCVFLADVLGWSGLLIEGDHARAMALAKKHCANPKIQTRHAYVHRENINALFEEAGVPETPDILSIDIDGNDFWIWSAIDGIRPRVVIVEYNAGLDPSSTLVQPYVAHWQWDGTDFFGASLGAFQLLGESLGYRLVHTELAGVNAFFVRDDLLQAFSDLDLEMVPRRPANYVHQGHGHPPDPQARTYLTLGAAGA